MSDPVEPSGVESFVDRSDALSGLRSRQSQRTDTKLLFFTQGKEQIAEMSFLLIVW